MFMNEILKDILIPLFLYIKDNSKTKEIAKEFKSILLKIDRTLQERFIQLLYFIIKEYAIQENFTQKNSDSLKWAKKITEIPYP